MINLCNRTEYSFRYAYGTLNRVVMVKNNMTFAAGICDRHGTWGHVQFEKECQKHFIKPIFGVELAMVPRPQIDDNEGTRWLRFIALTDKGLKQIYELTTRATEQFHKFPRIGPEDLLHLNQDVVVISKYPLEALPESSGPSFYLDLNPSTPEFAINWAIKNNIQPIATSDNYFPHPYDRETYEICVGQGSDKKSKPMHILSEEEWIFHTKCPEEMKKVAIANTYDVAQKANVKLPRAKLVKPPVEMTLRQMCEKAAPNRGVDLADPVYKERLDRELGLIEAKNFEDYFFLIADLVVNMKKRMIVGPARGSSCGSLVCYLLSITEVDPIPYGLLFERFIDLNRDDLPDIDIDFPDNRRDDVFGYLMTTYGAECVAQLGTVSKFKGKSVVGEAARQLDIAPWDLTDFKENLIERSPGDKRSNMCVSDTFTETEIGRRTLAKFPELVIAGRFEGHARHAGRHAAGIVVTAHPVSWYCSVDVQTGSAQVDKNDAEELDLLKIDALGLRTLTLIQDCIDQVGWTCDDLLKYPLDDQDAFNIVNEKNFSGIFQFEGQTLQSLCHQIKINTFEDIVSLTALARPGPLNSGMTSEWMTRKMGRKDVSYEHPLMEEPLKPSLGVVVYQEQIMQIMRNLGQMSWEDVSALRKAMGKSKGKEFFDRYRDKFLEGAIDHGFKEEDAADFWERILAFGAYCFNRSHAVAYSMVSYWCMLLKAKFPLEYAAACLRHPKDDDQIIDTLRELHHEGFTYKAFDPEYSEENWIVKDGVLIGGLTGVQGIGPKTAKDIIKRRKSGMKLTERQQAILDEAITPYDTLFECREKWGHIFENPHEYKIKSRLRFLEEIQDDTEGRVVFIAKMVERDLRDQNEPARVKKRGGKLIEDGCNLFLAVKFKDDTGEINAFVNRFKYPDFGRIMFEEHEIDSWYIVAGTTSKGFRNVFIDKVKLLTKKDTE